MSGCDHEWRRAPDRDRAKGPLPDGRAGTSYLMFWCPKCGEAKVSVVDLDAAVPADSQPEEPTT